MINKYPRTCHLPFSPEVHSDDKVIKTAHLQGFVNKRIIITEKLDGGNSCWKGKQGVFSRSHGAIARDPWFDHCKGEYYSKIHLIQNNEWIFGENLFATHSIEYDKLTTYFYIFALFDSSTNKWAAWDNVTKKANSLSVPVAPTLFDGSVRNMHELEVWMNNEISKPSDFGSDREGFVVRAAGEFGSNDFSKNVAKYVRKGHVQTNEHWSKTWRQAKLK